ncbi:MAG: hypothetical protein U5K69_01890 [Balneolaceae bacterium]|nr:hypothetical protein [Balneolaceae bacterium]
MRLFILIEGWLVVDRLHVVVIAEGFGGRLVRLADGSGWCGLLGEGGVGDQAAGGGQGQDQGEGKRFGGEGFEISHSINAGFVVDNYVM